ncbi:hypothetical protein FE257_003719 [Aspergillus nanangensis]|uniref:Xylanolytic transcriptional activator regulatory domain-containing protein n=1 Tax=Aspergillus nanangensis TaxID=2582783 RepID=A0AAD4CU06_ASPNN|nr:hypothetical protein FE257_003719 [Aspergillus nanangensis]
MCDALAPSCSSCSEAGEPCLAWNPATRGPAPRSIARYLEERIASLEAGRNVNPGPSGLTSASPAASMPTSAAITHALADITPGFMGLVQDSRLAGCVAVPTQIPSVSRSFDLQDPRSILDEQSSVLCPTSIPARVANILFNIYSNRIVHHYPVFNFTEVEQAFNSVVHTTFPLAELDARSVYIVSMVMAISLSTAARSNFQHAQSLAIALFNNATQHLPTVLTNDLKGLQALLVLIQYTIFNPHAGNCWLLTGISSEACIDLGLHQELPDSVGLDPREREERRRIFWSAWEMEVAVSAGFRRPIRILNRYITTLFPTESRPHAIGGGEATSETMTPTLHAITIFIWRFRQIESEVISILHDNQPLPPNTPSIDIWIARMESNMRSWREEVRQSAAANTYASLQSQWDEIVLYSDIGYPYILVLLYGPSDRVRIPTRPNLMRAFHASVEVATGYWENSNTEFGRIKYAFHPCHQTWSAAIVWIQALQNCKLEISESYTLQQVEEHAHCFSRLFSTISERWRAVSRCLEEFNRLVVPIKQSFAEFVTQRNDDLLQLTMQDPSGSASRIAFDTVDYQDFTPILNPFLTGLEESWVFPTTVMPDDWDVEFGFTMDNIDQMNS